MIDNGKQRVIFFREIPCNGLNPLQAYHALAEPQKPSTLFEFTQEKFEKASRFSFLGFNPIATFKSKNRKTEITKGNEKVVSLEPPYDLLREFVKDFKPAKDSQHPLFTDDIFGFVSYDAVRLVAGIHDSLPDLDDVPDLYFILYKHILIFDHSQKTLTIAVSLNFDSQAEQANRELDEIEAKVLAPLPDLHLKESIEIPAVTDMEDSQYREVVLKVKDYIKRGHVFQLVISRSFTVPNHKTPFQIYRILCGLNPSPYQFLFAAEDFAIVGASPEKLFSVLQGEVETIPVGGTHPKEKGKSDDEIIKELLSDPKEMAEHMMKMEVARNDLGSISEPGSIQIIELMGTRVFSHVIHIITKIRGRIKQGKDYIDAMQTILPGVPVSGSPKMRSLDIIEEYEKSRRGFYGGAICLIDTQENLLSCITIRSIFVKENYAKVRAGATIVAYSDPQYEADESRHKAQGPLKALRNPL